MAAEPASHLHRLHQQMERRFRIVEAGPAVQSAVGFLENTTLPVHRWFRYKESFGASLMTALGLDSLRLQHDTAVVDPFCGVGTSLLAADLQLSWKAARIGIEVNPFSAFAAETKITWRRYSAQRLERLAKQVLAAPLKTDVDEREWQHFRHSMTQGCSLRTGLAN
jgi:hypothetical protein